MDLLFIPEILGEHSLRFPVQVQNILVGYEEPLVQENMTFKIANALIDQPKVLAWNKTE